MKKILVICGPTATGKTALAIKLAKRFDGEVISADSRQVYKRLNIGTGKDLIPNTKYKTLNAKLGGYYEIDEIKVWGYDLVEPETEFSVALFVKYARAIISDVWARNKLPILTGGTGFYIRAITDGIGTTSIPKNSKLRQSLSEKTREELFEILANLDALKAASLNLSDRKNPRRLVRAIEVANWLALSHTETQKATHFQANLFFVGLTLPKELLEMRIDERIKNRDRRGIEREIRELLNEKVSWRHQSMSSLGYRQWQDYFEGIKTKEQTIKDWKIEEHKYAKRQLTWFKKDKRINWFDVSKDNWLPQVEKSVEKWYITH